MKKSEVQLQEELKYINDHHLDLDSALEVIENGISGNAELEIVMLKRRLAELQKHSGIGFLEFLNTRISEKKQLKESVSAYYDVRSSVENYLHPQKDVRMNDINYEWLSAFIRYKKSSGAPRGVNSYLRTMRAVYKESQKRESLNIKIDNPFLG